MVGNHSNKNKIYIKKNPKNALFPGFYFSCKEYFDY
jgi:hypothetical protein